MPGTSQTTKSGTRKLSETAKHLVVPTGITSTEWSAVRRTCTDKLGIDFDDWQDAAGRVILAKRKDGNLAAMIDGVGLSLPRQVGKTYLIGAMVFALCVNKPGLLVIWSAHHARTHGETFLAMQGFASRSKVDGHVKQVFTGSGDEEIRFHNGSRILFGARERGFGRGISGVDILIFDEAQILSDRALSNMLATLNTSTFGLQLYIGTPPKPEDMSESFMRMRTEALAGTLADGAWVELGADQLADPNDRTQWARANPSFPTRTPAQSILRLQRKLTEDDFLREGMGVWGAEGGSRVIDAQSWAIVADEQSRPVTQLALGVDVSPDRSVASVALAGQRKDGSWHIELDEQRNSAGWLAAYVAERCERNDIRAVVINGNSSATVIDELKQKYRITVSTTSAGQLAQACGSFYDGVMEGWLHHTDQPQVNSALAVARKRPLGDSWAWNRKGATSDITPIVACTLALWGAQSSTVSRPKNRSGSGRVVVLT